MPVSFSQPTFIAEIGLNHNGNLGLIPELIRQASFASANYAKFQLGWRSKPGEINHLDKDTLLLIHRICDFYNIQPLFSVFDSQSWELLKSVSHPSIVKIASRTLIDDFTLVKSISDQTNTLLVSTGMTDKSPKEFPDLRNAYFLWCQSLYPLLPFAIADFPREFSTDSHIGISDHSLGLSLSLLAASRGSLVFERHFTLDKSDITIRDHSLSLTPEEFRILVSEVKQIHSLLDFVNN